MLPSVQCVLLLQSAMLHFVSHVSFVFGTGTFCWEAFLVFLYGVGHFFSGVAFEDAGVAQQCFFEFLCTGLRVSLLNSEKMSCFCCKHNEMNFYFCKTVCF